MTRLPFGPLGLIFGLTTLGCAGQDRDRDGFPSHEDCDDDQANAWMARGEYEGDVTEDNAQRLCTG